MGGYCGAKGLSRTHDIVHLAAATSDPLVDDSLLGIPGLPEGPHFRIFWSPVSLGAPGCPVRGGERGQWVCVSELKLRVYG